MHDSVTFNAAFSYRFDAAASEWLRRMRVRLGVVNLADKAPPIATGQFTYSPSINQNMVTGRTWTLELTKSF
jgi:outer membrane receptor protein involved in Fe transport